MNSFNKYISLASLLALLLAFSRLSSVSKVAIPPLEFLRVQEVINLILVCFVSVLLSFFILKLSLNEKLLKEKVFGLISSVYLLGVFFYISGFSVHEFTNYWHVKWCLSGNLDFCSTLSFVDDTLSHVIFFVGFALVTASLVWVEFISTNKTVFYKNQKIILLANSALFGLGMFLNSAFEPALMDMVFSLIAIVALGAVVGLTKRKLEDSPFSYYLLTGFTLGFVSTFLYKLFN